MYDAVYLFARGLHGVQNAKNMNFRQNIMCNSSTSWEDGISLLNYMKTVCIEDIVFSIIELTGNIFNYGSNRYLPWCIDGWHNSCNRLKDTMFTKYKIYQWHYFKDDKMAYASNYKI